jgi:hypothetical protein
MTADNHDPFALARSDVADAELFALIAEYWRWEEAITKAGGNEDPCDDEVVRLCAQERAVRDRINQIRPTALRGILAALDFGSEMGEDPDYWPEGAIEGLRAIVEREARS